MNQKVFTKYIDKVVIGVLIASLLITFLPTLHVSQQLMTDITGMTFGDWFTQETVAGATDELNRNYARPAIVLLIGMVNDSSDMGYYGITIYYLLVLIGIPTLTILALILLWRNPDKKKRMQGILFIGIGIVIAISVPLLTPSFLGKILFDVLGGSSGSDIYSGAIYSVFFRILIRALSIGYWGFLVLQIFALALQIYRYIKSDEIESDEENVSFSNIHVSEENDKYSSTVTVHQKTGALIGVTGGYTGVEIELDTAGVVIGRDATVSQLIIDSSLISRRHCQIIYDVQKGQYIVTDYSSNGTYIANRRLMKGVAEFLPSGTVISLGDDKNSFRLQ